MYPNGSSQGAPFNIPLSNNPQNSYSDINYQQTPVQPYASPSHPMTSFPSRVQYLPTGQHLPQHTFIAPPAPFTPSYPYPNPPVSQNVGNNAGWLQHPINIPPPAFPQHFPASTSNIKFENDPVNSQKKMDEDWLASWLTSKNKIQQRPKANIPVQHVRSKLREVFIIIEDLKISAQSLVSSKDAAEDIWMYKMQNVNRLKERLQWIQQEIMNPSSYALIKKKIDKAKKKKERRKVKRKEEELRLAEQEKHRETKHKVLDAWQERLRGKVLEEKQKAEMKAEADNILGEVRKKIQEARRLQQQLVVLEKLRNARKENSIKKGFQFSAQSTENFNNGIAKANVILENQLAVYKVEEQALQVMLETEREEIREQEEQKLSKEIDEYFRDVTVSLFGNETGAPESPILQNFYQQYIPMDINALFRIRYEWDNFLTDKNNPTASSVPLGWVKPCPPSSDHWALALEKPK